MGRFFRWLVARKADYDSGMYELLPHIVRNAFYSLAIVVGAFIFGGPLIGVASLAVPVYVFFFFAMKYYEHERVSPRKGHRLQREDKVREKARKLREKNFPGDRGILWGKARISTKDSEKNFLVVGNIGSGKTLAIRMLMQDQLPLIRPGSNCRALVYDSKQDAVQVLAGMVLYCPVYIFNPFDQRGVAWDLAKDIDSIPVAETFAEYLIPKSSRASQPYFEDAPRLLLAAVLEVFIRVCPGRWTFRQLLLVMQSIERIEQVSAKNQDSYESVQAVLDKIGPRGRGNLLSTIVSKLRPYKTIAACWDGASASISVKRWLHEPSIIVLGNYEPARAEINRLASMFVDRLSKEILSSPENSDSRTWLYLDELTEAGELQGIDSLVLRARSKGCISVLGFQDIGALYNVYGREQGEAFVAQCGNRLYRHLKSHETAQWASRSIGQRQAFVESDGHVGGAEYVVPPEHFYKLPEANLHSSGVHGIYMNGSLGCWTAHHSPKDLKERLPQADPHVERFKLIDSARCEIRPWSEDDAGMFGIAYLPSRAADQTHDADDREDDPLAGVGRVKP